VNVAVPVPVSAALISTFCAVDQFCGVKVSCPPALTLSAVLPDVRVVVTVTSDVGARDSLTP